MDQNSTSNDDAERNRRIAILMQFQESDNNPAILYTTEKTDTGEYTVFIDFSKTPKGQYYAYPKGSEARIGQEILKERSRIVKMYRRLRDSGLPYAGIVSSLPRVVAEMTGAAHVPEHVQKPAPMPVPAPTPKPAPMPAPSPEPEPHDDFVPKVTYPLNPVEDASSFKITLHETVMDGTDATTCVPPPTITGPAYMPPPTITGPGYALPAPPAMEANTPFQDAPVDPNFQRPTNVPQNLVPGLHFYVVRGRKRWTKEGLMMLLDSYGIVNTDVTIIQFDRDDILVRVTASTRDGRRAVQFKDWHRSHAHSRVLLQALEKNRLHPNDVRVGSDGSIIVTNDSRQLFVAGLLAEEDEFALVKTIGKAKARAWSELIGTSTVEDDHDNEE